MLFPQEHYLKVKPKQSCLGVVAIEKGAFGSPSTKVAKFTSLMSEKEKKRERIYDLLNAKTKPKKFPKWLEFFFMTTMKPRP